jgi:hypothetical protein
MTPLQDPPKPVDLPRAVRIPPRRAGAWVALAAGATSAALCGWLAHDPPGHLPAALLRAALVLSALLAAGSGLRLLLQLPLIEASELGIAIWFRGTYRRPFFVPWKRVRAIVLTRARPADRATGSAARNALGIEVIQDERFRLPPLEHGAEATVHGAAHADLTWSNRSIGGDPGRWVLLLQAMQRAHGGPADPERA